MNADALVERARGLVLRDRAAARKALAGLREAEIEEELDALEHEERARQKHDAEKAQHENERASAAEELVKIRRDQHAAAGRFDAAVVALEREFLALEALNARADAAARKAETEGARNLIARTTSLTKCFWSLAPSLAKRLRLAGVPGGRSRAAPLATAYPKPKEK